MNLKARFLVALSLTSISSGVMCDLPWSNIPTGYKLKRDRLVITTKTPPAFMYLEDTAHRRSGINPSYSTKLDPHGILKDPKGFLCEIPISNNDQQNMADENTGKLHPRTPYLVEVLDGGNQTYLIHLGGLTDGIQRITANDLPPSHPNNPEGTKIYVLIEKGVEKQIKLNVDANLHTVSFARITKLDELPGDLNVACALKQIDSDELCEELRKIAAKIKEAKRDHPDEIKNGLRELLNLLNRGVESGEHESKNVIKEPTYHVLHAEIESLLNQFDGESENSHSKIDNFEEGKEK